MRQSIALLSLLVVLPAASEGVIRRHDKEDQLYKDLGAQARFAPVALFEDVSGTSRGTGTANYIGVGKGGKKWFLTAAHVINDSMDSATVKLGGKTYSVDLASRIWVSNYESGLDDIGAFSILDPDNTLTMAPAKIWGGIKPIPAATADRWTGYAIGYGKYGNGNDGVGGSDNVKRGMTNKIDGLDVRYNEGRDVSYGYGADFDKNDAAHNKLDKTDFPAAKYNDGQTSSRSWLDLEGQLGQGDSGGGLFAEFGTDVAMVGIASSVYILGAGDQYRYGGMTKWTPFTKDNLGRIDRWTGVATVPEPGTLVALGLGAALALRRRRN